MTWRQISQAPRHGQGTELLPVDTFNPDSPVRFKDQERFMVMRYSGRLPMVGVRIEDTFHVVWIERQFGELYDHD